MVNGIELVAQSELQFLVIAMDGNHYGIDVEQIAGLENVGIPEAGAGFAWLLEVERIGEPNYVKQILIKKMTDVPILIHEPDELVTVAISEVQCVPAVLARAAGKIGVWGLAPREAGMLILIDFYKNKRFREWTHREASGA